MSSAIKNLQYSILSSVIAWTVSYWVNWSQGSTIFMANCVLRHCPSPIQISKYNVSLSKLRSSSLCIHVTTTQKQRKWGSGSQTQRRQILYTLSSMQNINGIWVNECIIMDVGLVTICRTHNILTWRMIRISKQWFNCSNIQNSENRTSHYLYFMSRISTNI